MNILTTEDARFIDREVPKQLGISLEILMENAGRGIVDALWGEYDLFSLNNGRSINSFVLFICGTGNNGADGLVAARHLMEQGVPAQIVLVGDINKCSDLFAVQIERCKAMGCSIDMYDEFNDWSNVAIAVEGIMGTGFTGRLREVTIDILNDIDTMRSQYNFDLWAIDVPAGLDATTGHVAEGTLTYDYTVTFGAIKQGLLLYPGKAVGGTAVVAPLGAPWQQVLGERVRTITIDSDLAEKIINYRTPMAHKGVNGNTLIIGGSNDMIGAPILAAEAAVHSGAGKVTLAVPKIIKQIVQRRVIPEVMVSSTENNKELWDSVYGPDANINDEATFRKTIAEGVSKQLERDSDYKFMIDVRAYAEKKVGKLQFPDALLKRIMLSNNEDKGAEFVEKNYEQSIKELEWHLIRDRIAQANNIKIEDADVRESAAQMARAQFAQYGMNNVPDEYIDKYVNDMLKNRKDIEPFVDAALDQKLSAVLKTIVKLKKKSVSLDEFNKLIEPADTEKPVKAKRTKKADKAENEEK